MRQGQTEDWENTIFELTAQHLPIENKGIDTRLVRRTGNPVFVGDQLPQIDGTQQGAQNRLGHIARLDDLQPIDFSTYQHWTSDTEIARLRAYMVDRALDAWDRRHAIAPYWRNVDAGELMAELIPPDIAHLREIFMDGGYATSDAIRNALTAAGYEVPAPRAWGAFIQRCFPGVAKDDRSTAKGWQLPTQ